MQFRLNGEKFATFPNFILHREGRWFMRLIAIELDTANVQIWPVYRQLFDWVTAAGQASLTFYIGGIGLRFLFQEVWPFVHIDIYQTGLEVHDR